MLLALDLAKVTGFALWHPTMQIPEWGKRVFDDNQNIAQAEFYNFLTRQIVDRKVDTIAIEAPFVSLQQIVAVERLYGMRGIVRLVCGLRPGIKFMSVTTGEWRKHFLGVVRAPKDVDPKKRTKWIKQKAREKCEERGWVCKSNDEADALGVLDYARAKLDFNYGTKTTPLFGAGMSEVPF
jgi:hypothetical protein